MTEERKKTYEDRAQELKKEYLIKLTEYQQSDNYLQFQKKLEEWKLNNKEKKASRKSKPPKKPKQPESMPKRPQSSYFVFSNERRSQMKTEHPNTKLTELSKLIANEWKVISAERKTHYENKAKENKINYTQRMEQYKKTTEYSEYMEKLEEWKREKKRWENSTSDEEIGGGFSKVKISLPRKPKDDKCPKRPLTSYFLYAKEVRETTKSEFPNLAITEIAKEISKKWKILSEDEKKPYNEEAARRKEKYKEDLAEYEGSDAQLAFKKKLDEWKVECDRRKQAAKAKAAKMRQKKKSPKKSPSKSKTRGRPKKKQQRMEVESDDSSSDSDSDSDSSSGSGSSDSDSDSSSGSDSVIVIHHLDQDQVIVIVIQVR